MFFALPCRFTPPFRLQSNGTKTQFTYVYEQEGPDGFVYRGIINSSHGYFDIGRYSDIAAAAAAVDLKLVELGNEPPKLNFPESYDRYLTKLSSRPASSCAAEHAQPVPTTPATATATASGNDADGDTDGPTSPRPVRTRKRVQKFAFPTTQTQAHARRLQTAVSARITPVSAETREARPLPPTKSTLPTPSKQVLRKLARKPCSTAMVKFTHYRTLPDTSIPPPENPPACL